MIQRFFSAIVPALKEGGRIIWVGTPITANCALERLMNDDEENEFHKVRIPAIKSNGPLTIDSIPTWPQSYTIEFLLDRKRKMGTASFNQEYLLKPMDEDSIFKLQWIKYYDPLDIELLPKTIVAACDPSVGNKMSSDFKALIVIARTEIETPRYYVLHAWIRKATIGEMTDQIFHIQNRYAPISFGFETNGFQQVLANLIYEKMSRMRLPIPIKEIQNTTNKELRVNSIAPHIERGLVYFLKDDPDQELLIDQFLLFPNGEHDDGPDVFQMAFSTLTTLNIDFSFKGGDKRISKSKVMDEFLGKGKKGRRGASLVDSRR